MNSWHTWTGRLAGNRCYFEASRLVTAYLFGLEFEFLQQIINGWPTDAQQFGSL